MTPPTERGYYWAKVRGFADEWQIVRLSVYPSYLDGVQPVLFLIGRGFPYTIDALLDWRGPIAPPAEVEYK